MTTTIVTSPSTSARGTRRRRGLVPLLSRVAGSRVLISLWSLAGAAVVVWGIRLDWVTTFQGLIGQAGWGTRNGWILFGLAVAAGVIAVAQLVRPAPLLRWALALVGFGILGFAGYLLVQLFALIGQIDAMAFAGKGPGLYVVAAGGMVVFSTVFLPTPGAARSVEPGTTVDAGAAAPVASSAPTRHGWLSASTHSARRWPVALLAVGAALAHVPVTPEHMSEAPYLGWLFLALTVVLLLSATLLVTTDARLAYGVIALVSTLAVLAYVVSRIVGLPQATDDIGQWFEPLGVVSVLTEAGAAVLAVHVLRRSRGR